MESEKKIKKPEELKKITENSKKKGKTIVLCHGVFDLFHFGHLLYFEAAKKEGDILIASLTADEFVNKGINRPVFSHFIRAKILANLELIDYVVIDFHKTAVELIKKIKPNVYFKGKECLEKLKDKESGLYKEAMAIKSIGGDIKFSFTPSYSSTQILKNYFGLYPEETKNFLEEFSKKFQAKELIEMTESVKNLKVLIIGEAIIDEYHYCKETGKVPKDNLVGNLYLNEERFLGGVLASANLLANFCQKVELLTVLGEKEKDLKLIKKNLKENVKPCFFFERNRKTIIKRRFFNFSSMKKLLEIHYFDDRKIFPETSLKITRFLTENLKKYDLVIVEDFGLGLFTEEIIKILTQKAKFLAVMVQTNDNNYGFNLVTKYPKADYVCVDETEARLASGLRYENIEKAAKKIFKLTKVKNLIITMGNKGSMAFLPEGKIYKAPIFSTKAVDSLGAGDTFFSFTSLLAAKKFPIEAINFLGNIIGVLKATTIVGHRSVVSKEQVCECISALLK
jgi:rfaE bifunctional protein nucleotidyltransferase chain/domain